MSAKSMQVVINQAAQLVRSFFDGLGEEEISFLPEVLRSDGVWMTVCDESILAIFFLDEAEQKRIEHHKKNGWHPFPGFIIANSEQSAHQPAAYDVRGPLHFYSSKQTSNVYAFRVSPDSSCSVSGHVHRIVDSSKTEFQYKIHIAFILGLGKEDEWSHVKPRLSELLDHSIGAWKKEGAIDLGGNGERIDIIYDSDLCDRYSCLDMYQKSHYRRYEFAQRIIGADTVNGDFACGTGYGSMILSTKSKKVVGADINKQVIDEVSKRYKNAKNVEFIHKDILKLDYEDVFDNIISFETVEHLPEEDISMLLKIYHKALKSGGKIIFSTPYMQEKSRVAMEAGFHLTFYINEQIIEKWMEEAGFEIECFKYQDYVNHTIMDYLRKKDFIICVAKKVHRHNPKVEDETVNFDVKSIADGHHKVTYRGVKAIRCPFDYVIYQMIISEFQPDLVIEIGTNVGGGALYLADLLNNIGHGMLHTIDIKKQSAEIVARHPRIELFTNGWEGYDLAQTKKFSRVLVIEDGSHVYEETVKALHKFAPIVTPGSYLIVEDGIINELGMKEQYKGGPLRAIRQFLETNKNFEIDRRWCDLFGTNATFNVNGYLKRVN